MAKLSLKTLLGRARATAPAPAAEVTSSREAAVAELAVAEAAVAASEAAYRAGLIDADDDALRGLAAAQAEAGLRRDRAKALVDRFDRQLADIRAAEDKAIEDERQAKLAEIVARAEASAEALRVAVEHDVAVMAEKARGLVDLANGAHQDREAAIHALREAGDQKELPPVEAFRVTAGRPEKVLSTERVDLWVDISGQPVGYQSEIVEGSDGCGSLKLPRASHTLRFNQRRQFERQEYLAAQPARAPWPLADTLREIATALGRIEVPVEPAGDDRKPAIRLRPVAPPVDVQKRVEPTRRAG